MKKNSKSGSVIVVSAPSGAGKTSICNEIVKSCPDTVYSISYTTRLPRSGEKNGTEYFFTDKTKFKNMIKENKFAEWAEVHGNYYGTPKTSLDKILKSGKNVLLDIDVQGGLKIKKQYLGACMIFVMTPDIKSLKERLTLRNKDSKNTINMRMKNAKKELESLAKYEYLVINNKFEEAVDCVKTIIRSLEYKIQKEKKYF